MQKAAQVRVEREGLISSSLNGRCVSDVAWIGMDDETLDM
jgi:hypothetical protein